MRSTWIPLAFKVAGKRGFSEACPQPGHTAVSQYAQCSSGIRLSQDMSEHLEHKMPYKVLCNRCFWGDMPILMSVNYK